MNPSHIGTIVRQTRNSLKLNQSDLAMTAGTATRFISDLENGKPGCHLGKTLDVLNALGIRMELLPPATGDKS